MEELVGDFQYPKSSSGLSECPAIPSPQMWPYQKLNNISGNNQYLARADQLAQIGDCNEISQFHKKEFLPKPLKTQGEFEIINPNFGLDWAPSFFQIPDNATCACENGTVPSAVTSFDPRLVYSLRGNEPLTLNQPPYTGSVRLNRIYNKRWDPYGKHYQNYKDIDGGQIMYYLDREINRPFKQPVSTITSKVEPYIYQTPMTSYWPQYKKTPLSRDCRYLSEQQFTRDTVRNREELMALQSGKRLRQQWPVG